MSGRVLLVEDSDTQALMIRRVLERDGFAVERADSAEAALDCLNRAVPDLVVCDYHLPGMNGGELVRALRLSVRTRATPVLMLTEAAEPGLEREGLESGADAYVPKSSDQSLILLRIRALLRQNGAHEPESGGFGREVGLFRKARVLLVRDPGEAAETLAGLVGRDGHDVRTASAHDAALQAARDATDCVVVDLQASGFDGIALCAALHAARQSETWIGSLRILGLGNGDRPAGRLLVARAYGAGVDDLVSEEGGAEAIGLRIRAVVRRKLLQDETARIETELRGRQAAIDRAREEASAHAAKAALAEALAEANDRLREAQGKLVQSAKMASLGELVAGIAHEINNPLAFILAHQGTVARLLEQLDGAAPPDGAPTDWAPKLGKARERVASMSLGLKRIQNLVLNLRKFSRLDESEHQSVDVPDAIDTVLTLLTHKLGSGITISRDYQAPHDLLCQPALLNQVIMNIVGNAADALNARNEDAAPMRPGLISIETRLRDGAYEIAIADNGPGVPEALRERVFEPFFTTKPVGSGTGLGLAIAYSVVQAHGGAITLESAAEGGARFVVSVPIEEDRA
jgi:two-component system NtrC family sensor kinase